MKTEIMGSCHCGEEDLELARSCGAEAMSFLGRVMPGIPHEDYRVLVMTTALKKNRNPTTKDFALAKARVDRVLVDKGLGISIPAARPGRVTR
jgi:N-acyl-D-aspartate/D-glutamate deacylase